MSSSMYPIYYAYKGCISEDEEVIKDYMCEVYQLGKRALENDIEVIFDLQELIVWCANNSTTINDLKLEGLDIEKVLEVIE